MDCSHVLPESSASETVQVEMLPNKSFWHGLTRQAVDKLTIICGSNEEFEKRMKYAVTLAKRRKPKNVTAFLYKAIEEDYRRRDQEAKEAVEREIQAKAEREEWELVAQKMFADAISLDVEETPFDESTEMGRASVRVVRDALKAGHLNITAKRLLEQQGMSVTRFIELYCHR